MELAHKAEMAEFLHQSRTEIDAGRTRPAIEALKQLSKKHKLPTMPQ